MYRFIVSLFAAAVSLIAMVCGILLANSANLTFWQMISYDLLFAGQFLTCIWCAVLYTRDEGSPE